MTPGTLCRQTSWPADFMRFSISSSVSRPADEPPYRLALTTGVRWLRTARPLRMPCGGIGSSRSHVAVSIPGVLMFGSLRMRRRTPAGC